MLVSRSWYFGLTNPRHWMNIDLDIVNLDWNKIISILSQPRFSLLETLSVPVQTYNRRTITSVLPKIKNLKNLVMIEFGKKKKKL